MTLPIRTWAEQQKHERLVGGQASRAAWVRSLAAHHVNLSAAASAIGCPHSTMQRLAKMYDVRFGRKVRMWNGRKSPINEAELRRLAAKGITARDVADRWGCSYAAAHNFAKRRGIPLQAEAVTAQKECAPKPTAPKPSKGKALTAIGIMAKFAALENRAMRKSWGLR